MTSKSTRNTRLQADFERNRVEANWKKVVELAENFRAQTPSGQDGHLALLLLGEGKLELYLEEHPPIPANFQSAKLGLSEAKSYLNQCVCDHEKRMTVSLDAMLLLAKLEYATGDYSAALNRLSNAGLDKLQEKSLTMRSLKIVAESFAIQGLCLEQTTLNRTSRYKRADKHARIVRCFEQASDLTLLFLQEQDKISSTPSTASLPSLSASTNTGGSNSPLPPAGDAPEHKSKMGVILETALTRATALHCKAGDVQAAVDRHRSLLSAIECSGSQQMRLTVCMQLAELLMRAVSTASYVPPALHESSGGKERQAKNSEGSWKPRRYGGLNLFVPSTRSEEIILLLLISEAMAVRDAVLSQSPEFAETRERANSAATAVQDMLAAALAPTRQYQILIEIRAVKAHPQIRAVKAHPPDTGCQGTPRRYGLSRHTPQIQANQVLPLQVYERSMKFSWGCGHVWRQFGLALCSGRQPLRGVQVLQEAHRLQPSSPITCLVAAKVSFQSLNRIDEGLEWVRKAQNALEHPPSAAHSRNSGGNNSACPALLSPQLLLARCCLYHGIGLILKLQQTTVYSKSLAYRREAMQLLLRASELDPSDHVCQFYLAESYASCRQLQQAVQHIRMALCLRPDHLPSLLLLLLLLEALGETEESLRLVAGVQAEYPRSLQAVSVAVALQEQLQGPDVALVTATHMMALWHILYRNQLSGEGDAAEVASAHTAHPDQNSVYNASEDNDNASVCGGGAESVSRVEFALSEVASSVSGSHSPKPAPQHAWALQIHCWLTIARLYLRLERTNEAAQCIQEASSIFPMNHQIMFMKGQVYEHKGEVAEARTCYENALALNPHHTTSLRHLVRGGGESTPCEGWGESAPCEGRGSVSTV
ncbi:Tetratricopeptide repeat 2 [Trinorchestia longiramus]|nr:Tetratricopeptide repeat 2 [Trinorchestia longiramus]